MKPTPSSMIDVISNHGANETNRVSPTTEPATGSKQHKAQAKIPSLNTKFFLFFISIFVYIGKDKPWSIVHGQEKF